MTPLYIFDIDGTMADSTHRHHLIAGQPYDQVDWPAFFEHAHLDPRIHAVCDTLNLLSKDAEIRFFTARDTRSRGKTIKWLTDHTSLNEKLLIGSTLTMRQSNDFRPDHVVKMEWYDAMSPEDKARLVAVFEDRQSVVDAWRAKGVVCFQVAPGDF